MIDLCNEYGVQAARMIKLWIGAKLAIIVTNPKYIEVCTSIISNRCSYVVNILQDSHTFLQKILTSPAAIEKDSVYDFIGLVGNGLFVRNGIK